jgi:FMN phosphatase YigB (HAD superfamily)
VVPIEFVCFDVGGVLVRICRSWSEACRAAGVLEVNVDREPIRERTLLLNQWHQIGKLTFREWAELNAEAYAGFYSAEDLARIHDAWLIREYDGVAQLIEALNQLSLTTACLSNTVPGHWRRLVHQDDGQALTGQPEFPAVCRLRRHFASHLMGLAQPDPVIYRTLQQQVGVAPERILFFDDLAENIEAARRSGWHAVLIDPTSETAPQIRAALQERRVMR